MIKMNFMALFTGMCTNQIKQKDSIETSLTAKQYRKREKSPDEFS